MAKRVVSYVILIDDLDGVELPRGTGQTIRYGWKGQEYEIDLSDGHAEELDRTMSNLVSKSTRVGRLPAGGVRKPDNRGRLDAPGAQRSVARAESAAKALESGQEPSVTAQRAAETEKRRAIRTWARDHGIEQSMVGRIKEEAFDAWDAAHPDDPSGDLRDRS